MANTEEQQQPMMAQSQVTRTAPQPQPTIMIVQVQESCRNNCRIVAWVDIILGVINVVCNLIVLVLCALVIRNDKEYEPYIAMAMLTITVLGVIFSGLEIWIAARLLNATNMSTPRFLAVHKAQGWRSYHIFLIIFSLLTGGINIGGIYRGKYYVGGYHFVCFVIHCLFIYIVHRFIRELLYPGGEDPIVVAGGTSVVNTTIQYQQHPTQFQQQPQNQVQQQPEPQSQQ